MEPQIILTPVLPESKEAYEAPVIEIAEVRVERGFQASGDGVDDNRGDATY